MTVERDFMISFQGHQVHCEVTGYGEPILCLHGLNLDHNMFKTLKVKDVLDHKMIIAVDLPGYGKSDFIPNADFRVINQLLSAVSDFFGLKQFELCGFCLGGIFALDFCIRNEKAVSKLFLIETMIYLPWWMNVCLFPFFSKVYQAIFSKKQIISRVGILPPFQQLGKKEIDLLMVKNWNQDVNSFYIQMMKEYGKIDHLKRSAHVDCETRIITAKNTFHAIKRTCRDLHKNMRCVKIVSLDEKGHFVY